MHIALVIQLQTPKKFILSGLWFGPAKPKRVVILVHGLTGSAFGGSAIREALLALDPRTAVLAFNNRGFESVVDIKQRKGTKTKHHAMGGTHEVFTDCADDIQGVVNFVRKQKVKEIYLAGHSTGCQKSIYWAAKTGGTGVKGVMLFAPISDYSSEKKNDKGGRMKKATALARKLVKTGRPHELLPRSASPIMLLDAQRYLSLYTPESAEEIFTYGHDKKPKTYASVRLPVLALFADKDEYADRPAEKMAEWFARNTGSRYFRAGIVPRVGHGFKGGEKEVVRIVRKWVVGALQK